MSEQAQSTTLSREQFSLRLDHIEMEYIRAMKAANTLQTVFPTARERAMQMSMNIMVEDLIVQLEMETNVTVAYTRNETVNGVPYPPRMNRQQTMINFDNGR